MVMLLKWRRWQFKNTTLLIISLILFFYFAETAFVQSLLRGAGYLGYLGAFLAGLFFVSTFTVAPAAAVLFKLADTYHPVEVALLAGAGAMLGDYLIYRYMRDKVFDELVPVFQRMGGKYLVDLFKTPFFAWLVPFVGAAIIALPIPDELGISMLGLSKLKQWQFLLLTFTLNAAGILAIVILARL